MPLTPGGGDLEEGRPGPGGPCSVGCRVEHLQRAHWSLPGAQGDETTARHCPHLSSPHGFLGTRGPCTARSQPGLAWEGGSKSRAAGPVLVLLEAAGSGSSPGEA